MLVRVWLNQLFFWNDSFLKRWLQRTKTIPPFETILWNDSFHPAFLKRCYFQLILLKHLILSFGSLTNKNKQIYVSRFWIKTHTENLFWTFKGFGFRLQWRSGTTSWAAPTPRPRAPGFLSATAPASPTKASPTTPATSTAFRRRLIKGYKIIKRLIIVAVKEEISF